MIVYLPSHKMFIQNIFAKCSVTTCRSVTKFCFPTLFNVMFRLFSKGFLFRDLVIVVPSKLEILLDRDRKLIWVTMFRPATNNYF